MIRDGDLVNLLSLSSLRQHSLFPTRSSVGGVYTLAGARWQPDVASDILLIGDSFLEIYSSEQDGRVAAGAGLAEQLSYHLQRPVDRIAKHTGEYGVREALGDSIAQLRQQAKGRKVIIWQFAVRKLAFDDWPLMQ